MRDSTTGLNPIHRYSESSALRISYQSLTANLLTHVCLQVIPRQTQHANYNENQCYAVALVQYCKFPYSIHAE